MIGAVMGKGLVAGVHMVKPGTMEPNKALADAIVESCIGKGLLMIHPVGVGGNLLKIAPPLVTPEDAIVEALGVLAEAIAEVK